MSEPTVSTGAPTKPQDENQSVVKAAGMIGVATFSSRILGFIRDMVLAKLFGATPAADAFFVAYRIPNLLRELFAEGSMSAAFIPVFTEYHTLKSKQDAWELASAVFTTLLTIVIGITMLGTLGAAGIVWLLAPGFHDDPARLEMTTLLTRIMFPYLIFISLAALAMGILNSLRAFAAPAFSPVFFNLFIIGCSLFLAPTMREPILGVAIGVVAGGAAQFAMQLPGLKLRGMLFGFTFNPGHPGVRKIGRLMIPSLLGLSVTQINITVSTILGSFFAGGPTYLFYGMRLIQFPLGIFGVALATAILPTLSAQAARGALDELRTTLGFGLRMILFIILPAMAGLILLRTPIVHLFFEHGTFTAHDTAETAFAVLCYSLGLWAFGGVRIIVSAFYSLKDTTTPAVSAAIAVVANILFSLALMSRLGAAGLALATALAAMVNGGILVVVLNRRLGGIEWKSVIRSAGRVLVACVPIVVACWWVAEARIWNHPAEWVAKSALLFAAIGLSVGGYLGVHALLRSEELGVVWGMARKKLGRVAGR
ncbi:murein biosynthesis integral membrane protein MurJ [Candidatus Nitrospira nitrificans]|uniref:Probable lipid II flippase MurJ n=1 Tax=Candidatus Nitrospira nitrificans TaxID=1742973 RepID=A0A0S4LW91_9BACT|nr:murein biosynthesis integral membrane protein MurJ [Candidatus Nitrospira nitrificans]CUS39282.1 Protein MurJ homolog [Candidatus Nitrospira nitrificans]